MISKKKLKTIICRKTSGRLGERAVYLLACPVFIAVKPPAGVTLTYVRANDLDRSRGRPVPWDGPSANSSWSGGPGKRAARRRRWSRRRTADERMRALAIFPRPTGARGAVRPPSARIATAARRCRRRRRATYLSSRPLVLLPRAGCPRISVYLLPPSLPFRSRTGTARSDTGPGGVCTVRRTARPSPRARPGGRRRRRCRRADGTWNGNCTGTGRKRPKVCRATDGADAPTRTGNRRTGYTYMCTGYRAAGRPAGTGALVDMRGPVAADRRK